MILHGTDAWTSYRGYRTRLLGRRGVRAAAVSNFTAGALVTRSQAPVLPPGLSHQWFTALATAPRVHSGRLGVLTVFRLGAWNDKGMPTLLAALRQLDNPGLHLTVCGSGEVPDDLREALRREPRCELVNNPNDSELARRFASAFVVVLATRTRPESTPSGEGFGMVLLETQVAGVPVIATAYGGRATHSSTDLPAWLRPTNRLEPWLASCADSSTSPACGVAWHSRRPSGRGRGSIRMCTPIG